MTTGSRRSTFQQGTMARLAARLANAPSVSGTALLQQQHWKTKHGGGQI
jgi:hypothetical protein